MHVSSTIRALFVSQMRITVFLLSVGTKTKMLEHPGPVVSANHLPNSLKNWRVNWAVRVALDCMGTDSSWGESPAYLSQCEQ